MQSRQLAYLLFPMAAVIFNAAARGDILAQYSFTDVVASQLNRDATTVAPNVTAGTIADAPIVFTHPMVELVRTTGVGYATEPVLSAQREPWNESLDPENVYFTFSVAANTGFELDISSLDFNVARGGAATPRTYDVRTSLNGVDFASLTGVVEINAQRPTFTPVSIDLSGAQFQDLSSPLTFRIHFFSPDFNQNVDFDDITVNGTVVAVDPGLTGDFNNDGSVDAADYTTWRDNLGALTALPNEASTPGMVTTEDYDDWKANFGEMAPAAGAGGLSAGAVPEPASLVLLGLTALAATVHRTRR